MVNAILTFSASPDAQILINELNQNGVAPAGQQNHFKQ